MGNRAASRNLVELGNRIRERRSELGLSQEVLAERAEISTNTVSRIEGGQTAMSVDTFMRLVRVLETDADSLLEGMIPAVTDDRYGDVPFRIGHLNRREKRVVMETVKTLVEELQRYV